VTRLGRKQLPAELVPSAEAFDRVLAVLEPAKEALAGTLPTNRLPGRPLADALHDYEDALERARSLMPAWRRAEVEDVWSRCAEGIDVALDRARRLRSDAPDLGGFEGLLGMIRDLLDPLDPLEDAAARFRDLRVRRVRR
jgi:hypothetical protein